MKKLIYFPLTIAVFVSIFGCGTAQKGAMIRAYSGIENREYGFSLKRLFEAEKYVDPEPALKAEISYLKGICFEGLSKMSDARAMYKFVIDKFPDSQYSYMARERLNSIETNNLLERNIFSNRDRKQRSTKKSIETAADDAVDKDDQENTKLNLADTEQTYDIKVGIIIKTKNGEHIVIKETTEIPYILKSEDQNFRFGFVVLKNKLKATDCYYTVNMPIPKEVATAVKGIFHQPNMQMEDKERLTVESKRFICKDGFSAAMQLDEGDQSGLYQIKIVADDDLIKTIVLNVTKKQ